MTESSHLLTLNRLQIHILQNNAGISKQCPAFSLSTSLEDLQSNWNAVLNTNFHGILNVAQAFAPHMARQENSSVIINTGNFIHVDCAYFQDRNRESQRLRMSSFIACLVKNRGRVSDILNGF